MSAWKPCDLRGIYPTDVSEDLFYRVGSALGSEMSLGETAVVCGDFRCSTPTLKSSLIEGLVSAGVHVFDCGQGPTPLAYFQAAAMQADALFVVTASHNPAEYNGLKWMIHGMPPQPADVARLRAAVEAEPIKRAGGRLDQLDPAPAYRQWVASRWTGSPLAPIVVDPGNGAWSELAPAILRDLGFEPHCLHCEPDGRFQNRPADCARTSNLSALRKAVIERGAALGIAWDGDGDRVAFVDENGVHASTDEVSILLARAVLADAQHGERVVCDIKLSDGVRREVLRLGGEPLIERSGHGFMRRRLLTTNAILGLDACGHYFLRECGLRDDGLYMALFMMRLIAQHGSLAHLRRSIEPIFSTPELRIPTAVLDYQAVVERLRRVFPHAEESSIDGARLVLPQGIVLARESSTEPMVSLRVEAFNSRAFEELLAQCLDSLPQARPLLVKQMDDSSATGRHRPPTRS